MNVSIDKFIDALERSTNALPGIFDDWAEFDEELRYEYVEQVQWMLCSRRDVLTRASNEGRFAEIDERIKNFNASIQSFRVELKEKMGIDVMEECP